jgi:hypothetical protein
MENSITEYLAKRKVQSLVRIMPASNLVDGARSLVDAYGLGELVPNTILLGASEEESHHDDFCSMIEYFHRSRRNVAVLRHNTERGFGSRRLIDVWWGGLKKNGGLMLILAYLLETSLSWRGAVVRIKMVVPTEQAAPAAQENLASFIRESRTGAIPQIIVDDGRPFDQILSESSRQADLVLLGMAEPNGSFGAYYDRLMARTADLPTTLFVMASEQLEFKEVLVEASEV